MGANKILESGRLLRLSTSLLEFKFQAATLENRISQSEVNLVFIQRT